MQYPPARLTLISLTLLTLASAACSTPSAGNVDESGTQDDTGAQGETGADGDGDGNGDGDGDGSGEDCAWACATQAACGVLEAGQVDDCVARCEQHIEGSAIVFGSECAEAELLWQACAIASECDGEEAIEECEPKGIDAYFTCTQTLIPEVDALCECLASDVEPSPSDPLDPKALCVIDIGRWMVDAFSADGAPCLDAFALAWACGADTCANPACDAEPAPDACLCTETDDAIEPACPTLEF